MIAGLKARLKSFLGELILTGYALLFLLARIPHWISLWLRGGAGGEKGGGRRKGKWGWTPWGRGKKKEKEELELQERGGRFSGPDGSKLELCAAPSLLADPNIGRHMFVKIQVRKIRVNFDTTKATMCVLR